MIRPDAATVTIVAAAARLKIGRKKAFGVVIDMTLNGMQSLVRSRSNLILFSTVKQTDPMKGLDGECNC